MSSEMSGENEPVRRPLTMRFGSILAWSAWIGLVSGTLELAVFLLKCRVPSTRGT